MSKKLSVILTNALLSVVWAATAVAATSEQGSSILIFPRVVADAQHDTVVQIVNGSYLPVQATCSYLRIGGDPETIEEVDWPIVLQPRQTTHWSATRGRPLDPNDPVCFGDGIEVIDSRCDGAGFDPGNVPPAPAGFAGEMICVQTDASGAPASGNALYGVATVVDTTDGSVAKLSAFGLRGLDTNNNDGELCIGQAASGACSTAAEYEGCPSRWMLVHPSESETGDAGGMATSLTVVTCAQDLVSQEPAEIDLDITVTNEFEQRFLVTATVLGSETIALSEISSVFDREVTGELLLSDMTSSNQRGFVVAAHIDRTDASGGHASLAANLHGDPAQIGAETIRVPQ